MNKNKFIKKQIIESSRDTPEKFFPVETLKSFGLKRQKCSKCGVMFWASIDRDICGDTPCVGTYTFIGNSPCPEPIEFQDVYFKFSEMLSKDGYEHVKNYPVVARWRDDLDFTVASIVDFQPFVVNGDVAPPAEHLTIPQGCLRFPDIDNIGYTGRHHTSFTMIGQHTFQKPENYKQDEYFRVWFEWYLNGLKISKDELVVHEDAWAGGGNCGASLEVFSHGLEIGNQVYMSYDMKEANDISELKELDLKVLDMGMGQERCCWISKGSKNSYEACFPEACKFLFDKVDYDFDFEVYDKFLPFSGNLNLDEVEDIDYEWQKIADEIKIDVKDLREKIEPIAGIYSIADHTKTLLMALTDGALPSNVKGGYNLRLILRRALDFINKYNWNIDLNDVMKIHAKNLSRLYPELSTELDGIKKIIDLEVVKYKAHKEKVENKIKTLVKKGKTLSTDDYIKYYISDGITPDEFEKSFKAQGVDVVIPQNFFTLVTEFFESRKISETKEKKNKLAEFIVGLPDTEMTFYEDVNMSSFESEIIKEFECDGENYIVLDKTIFYPTMGGQASDLGFIGDAKIVEAVKVGNVICHKVGK